MFTKKTLGIALAGALALGAFSGSAVATPVNVGGVTFDPSQTFNPIVQAIDFRETAVSADNTTLTGYGVVASLNGVSPITGGSFCSGCNLAFTFSYDLSASNSTQAVFDNGMINFYVVPSFSSTDPSSASNGALWLSLTGHTAAYAGFSDLGQLYATINGPSDNPMNGSSGFGLLDVSGGLAANYFNTNSQTDGSDFQLNSSFQTADGNDVCVDGQCYPIVGQGGLTGLATTPVPEPGPAGLLGVGLAALGLFMRRRRNEAAGRV